MRSGCSLKKMAQINSMIKKIKAYKKYKKNYLLNYYLEITYN